MTAIDTEEVLGLLREAGADLCETFWRHEPVMEVDDMMTAFRRIDGAANARLKLALGRLHPAIGWLEDELGDTVAEDAETAALAERGEYWICDAIDGAAHFLRAIPNWSMSLTLMREGVPVFSAIFDAVHDEMFHAVWGHGAYRNGERIRVNGRASHYQGIVATSQPPFAGRDRRAVRQAGVALSAMLPDVAAVRGPGATSLQLAYVACGRLDGYWQFGDDGFNCIGGALLVREAGGQATQVDGKPYGLGALSMAAAAPGAHASMLLRLQQALEA
ncbi:inositol monophosphatase family protein [Duganella sp. S19_KUP01_CR8]|uniref:inositol monophosphatase family protein n=1 Tax=Duganella sp. S19_KUP01_CR8 TaxID=3025502 RepID=UPI002FCD6CB2